VYHDGFLLIAGRANFLQPTSTSTKICTHVILLDGDSVVCDADTISPLGAVATASEANAARKRGYAYHENQSETRKAFPLLKGLALEDVSC